MRGLTTTVRRGRAWLVVGGLLGLVSLRAETVAVNDLIYWGLRVSGGLNGVYAPVPERPLAWSLTWAATPEVGRRTGEVRVTGEDFALRIALDYRGAEGRLSWRVVEGRVDLASWVPALAKRPELSAVPAGLDATGVIVISGEGAWAAGAATGELKAVWSDGVVRNEVQGWRLSGVTVRAGGDLAEWLRGRVPLDLAVKTITTTRFGARAFSAGATVVGGERIEVKAARVEIAGGEVIAEPFAVIPAGLSAEGVTLVLRRVGLQDLVVFAPTALAEALGRINGRLRLGWTRAGGVQIGEGELTLEDSEPMRVRLAPNPGFLTDRVPKRLEVLPFWLGPLARWFAPVNEAYGMLSDIELGRLGLKVESLDVRLTPGGDERGRSASVRARARPAEPGGAVGPVTFEINVAGPLADVLRMSLQQNVSVQQAR